MHIKSKIKRFGQVLWQSVQEYNEDKGERLAAALAFYAAFSLAPLLVIGMAIVGFFFGDEAAKGQIFGKLASFFSADVAKYIEDMVKAAGQSQSEGWAAALSTIPLLYGAARLFMALKDAIDIMWGTSHMRAAAARGEDISTLQRQRLESTSFKDTIKQWLISFSLVPVFGALLLCLILASTILSAINDVVAKFLSVPEFVTQLLNIGLSMVFMTATFAILFRVLPAMALRWKHVIGGAAITATFFVVAKSLLSIYFAYTSTGSVFGAAGTLAVLMMWLYFSAQIVLFGAEFTQVWVATHYDDEVENLKTSGVKDLAPDEDEDPQDPEASTVIKVKKSPKEEGSTQSA